MDTVEERKTQFTPQQIKRADRARQLFKALAYPTVDVQHDQELSRH